MYCNNCMAEVEGRQNLDGEFVCEFCEGKLK
jgi:hypothetical protein